MCNTPVTLGGGITTVYGSRLSGVDLKKPSFNQYAYHLSSISEGLYFAEISIYRKITHFYGRNGLFPFNIEFEKLKKPPF
jgi:hypothetical protein